MESKNLGRCINPQSRGLGEQQPRYCYGFHFSNLPPGTRNTDMQELFGDFGRCKVFMNPGAHYGWVGYNTMQSCNAAMAGLHRNMLGMRLRRGTPVYQTPIGDEHVMSYGLPPARLPRRPPPLRMDYYGEDFYDYYQDELCDFYGGMPFDYTPYEQMYPKPSDCDFGPCTLCDKETHYSCERCGAFYCSERCLRNDWSRHQDECNNTMPDLNRGPRKLPVVDDARDLSDRLQRVPINDDLDNRGSTDRPGSLRSDIEQEIRPSSDNGSNSGESRDGRYDQTQRRQGGFGRNEGRRPDDRFNRRQNQLPDNATEGGDNRRRLNDDRQVTGFPSRNDREQRDANGFGGDRRGQGDRHLMGGRRNDSGFNDRREGGGRGPVRNGYNANELNDHRGDGDRGPMRSGYDSNGLNDHREGGGRGPMRSEYNSNGLNDHRGDGDRGYNANGFNDRRPRDERNTANGFMDGRPSRIRNGNTSRGSSTSEVNRTELLPAESGVCINLKNNDHVIISAMVALNSIHVTPPMSAYSEEFRKMSSALASHCESAPALGKAPSQNQIVACRFKLDDQFYRAAVKIFLPENEFVIEFIDYGNLQKCKLNELRAVPDELKVCPRNTVKVSLRGVDTVPVNKKVEDFIDELGNNLVKLRLQFDGDISNGVELIMPNNESVNKVVRSMIGQAEKTSTSSKMDAPAPKVDARSPKVDARSPKVDARSPKVDAPSPKVDARSPKVDAPSPKANAPAPNVDAPAPKADIPAPKTNAASTSVAAKRPSSPEPALSSLLRKVKLLEPATTSPAEEGKCVEFSNDDTVVISVSVKTDSTYITAPNFYEPGGEFLNLTQKLIDHCNKAPALDRKPRKNEVVGCRDSNEIYCRAVVSEELPDGAYSMFFVDFGNVERCTADRIREVPNEMKILPRQAVEIRLRDVDPVPVDGEVKDVLQQLIDEGVSFKIRFDGSIANGVELLRLDGRSLNEELNAIIAKGKVLNAEEEDKEDLSPVDCVDLPTEPFKLLVFGILDEFNVMAADADCPEFHKFMEKNVPIIQDYCNARPGEEYRTKSGDMCLAKYKNEWFRGVAINVEEDETRSVLLVDQGETVRVKPRDMRKIPQHIREPLRLLNVCHIEIPGVPESGESWAKIEARLKRDLDRGEIVSFKDVTCMTEYGITSVNIPELKKLFLKEK